MSSLAAATVHRPSQGHSRRMIWVTFDKVGIHRWPDAPEETAYLRHPHRHVFKFRVWIAVGHDDREVEFHAFQSWIQSLYDEKLLQLDYRSCEMLADELHQSIAGRHRGREIWIEVSEDGENGSFTQYPGDIDPGMPAAASL